MRQEESTTGADGMGKVGKRVLSKLRISAPLPTGVQETAQKIFSGEIKSIMLLLISASAEDYSTKVEIARGIPLRTFKALAEFYRFL